MSDRNNDKLAVELRAAYGQDLPGDDFDDVVMDRTLAEAGENGNTPRTHYYLWKATHDPIHLTEAKNLLDNDLRDSRYFPLPGRSLYATILWEL